MHMMRMSSCVLTSACLQVLSVQGGVCEVKYDGPPPIAMGIRAAIRDKFPDITTVEMVA